MTTGDSGGFDEPGDPTPQPAGGAPDSGEAAADVGTRFLARLIDHVILTVVIFVIFIPLVIGAIFADVAGVGGLVGGGFSGGSIIAGIIGAALTIGYFAFMESSRGQTVGKMLLNLKTVGPDGNNPTMEEAVKRNGWYVLAIIPVIGGLAQLAVAIYIAVTISNSVANVGWHDEFAGGTRVLKTQ